MHPFIRALALGIVIGLGSAAAVPAGAAPLPDRRRLLVFASGAASTALATQRRLLAGDAAALRERDLDVVEDVVDAGGGSALRRRYAIAPGQFAVLLIGKDGGVKLRSDTPIAAARLTATIDTMPMRRDEMTTLKQ